MNRGLSPGAGAHIRAVILDVDGTLYSQRLLRARIALELFALPIEQRSLRRAWHTIEILRRFRRVREALRPPARVSGSLEELQYSLTAAELRVGVEEVRAVIDEWIFRRPLRHLERCRRRDVASFLSFLETRGMRAGILSDYPAAEKLAALGVDSQISLALCATDPEVNAFKPDPKGFLRFCELWALPAKEIVYVGDRADVDAPGALACGMSCAILSRGAVRWLRPGCLAIPSLSSLQEVLQGSRSITPSGVQIQAWRPRA